MLAKVGLSHGLWPGPWLEMQQARPWALRSHTHGLAWLGLDQAWPTAHLASSQSRQVTSQWVLQMLSPFFSTDHRDLPRQPMLPSKYIASMKSGIPLHIHTDVVGNGARDCISFLSEVCLHFK